MGTGICPLTGHPCDKDAAFTITEHLGNKGQSFVCCRDCATRVVSACNERTALGAALHHVVPLSEFIVCNLAGAVMCPQCGSTWREITKTGRLGCQTCYRTFQEQLDPHLQKKQAGAQHVGKSPLLEVSDGERIAVLEQKLKDACLVEDYEQAARCRDLLKKLRGGG